ncbi:MAG: hypothetical protein ABIF77_20350 [bacterium]
MTTSQTVLPLLYESPVDFGDELLPDSVLRELQRIALATDSLPDRSRTVYLTLRDMTKHPLLVVWLHGIQVLAQRNDPAGARLLAAFLDANTPGSRLLPRVQDFTSSRRLRPLAQLLSWSNAHFWNLEMRLSEIEARCNEYEVDQPMIRPLAGGTPAGEHPYPLLRRCLRSLVAEHVQDGDLPPSDRNLLAELIRLETQAYQERIANLAQRIDPFSLRIVGKVLPLLNRADVEIRDLWQLVDWIEAGEVEDAFRRCVPRFGEVLSGKERNAFRRRLRTAPELAPLAELQARLSQQCEPVSDLAGRVCRLMAMAHQLRLLELRQTNLDLLTATQLALQRNDEGEIWLPLDDTLTRAVTRILNRPRTGDGLAGWPLNGFRLLNDNLVLQFTPTGLGDRIWRHDLPVPDKEVLRFDTTSKKPLLGESERESDSQSGAAVRKMVLSNVASESTLLGLLRNPKVVGIPGLVADVVARCRNTRVLEMIAGDRRLYSGYANQTVPLALISSPCNIPIGTLRKFIQVKYVSKMDLSRLVRSKANLRDEVAREITAYLDYITR